MTNEKFPWLGLKFGRGRRVDKDGKQDFFWAVVENDKPALVLRLKDETERIRPLPGIRNLEVKYGNVMSSSALLIVLRELEHADLFTTLCRDIVAAAEAASDNDEALKRTLTRTLRWHHLLRGGRSERLSLEEQRGLIGELKFLELLCEHSTPRAVIESWKGPQGAAKDFELHNLHTEVKARRGASRPYVNISSEDQLADLDGVDLFLRVQDVDAAVRPQGLTLTDHVKCIDAIFQKADLASYQLWEYALTATGFEWKHDYSDLRWSVGKVRTYVVREGFPRIPLPLTAGVMNLKYAIALDACLPFLVDESEFEKRLKLE